MSDRSTDPAASAPAEVTTVDARGHRCPTPTLRLRRALEAARAGDCVRLLADDPLAAIDVPHFVQEAGHCLVESGQTAAGFSFLVRKRRPPSATHGAASAAD